MPPVETTALTLEFPLISKAEVHWSILMRSESNAHLNEQAQEHIYGEVLSEVLMYKDLLS